jgi:hypothetical protein
MRSTHMLFVEGLAGLPLIRQRLIFLNERLLVSALVKPNDLRMVKLLQSSIESGTIWTSFPNGRLSMTIGWYRGRTFYGVWPALGRFDICAKGTQRCAETPKLLCEGLGKLQRPTAIHTDGSKTEGLVGFGFFWMTGTRIGLDCLDTVVFSLLKCAPFIDFIVSKPKSVYIILTDSIVSIERLKSTRISYISYRIPSQFLEVSIFLS